MIPIWAAVLMALGAFYLGFGLAALLVAASKR